MTLEQRDEQAEQRREQSRRDDARRARILGEPIAKIDGDVFTADGERLTRVNLNDPYRAAEYMREVEARERK